MLGVGLQRRYSQNSFDTFIVNPYHVSCYGRVIIEGQSYTQVDVGPHSFDAVETVNQIAALIAVATGIKTHDVPPDVFYVHLGNLEAMKQNMRSVIR